MALTRTQKLGVVVILSSLVISIGGTIWSVYGAFSALETSEFTGLVHVSDSILNALIFTAFGLVGPMAGALIMIFGRSRSA